MDLTFTTPDIGTLERLVHGRGVVNTVGSQGGSVRLVEPGQKGRQNEDQPGGERLEYQYPVIR